MGYCMNLCLDLGFLGFLKMDCWVCVCILADVWVCFCVWLTRKICYWVCVCVCVLAGNQFVFVFLCVESSFLSVATCLLLEV